MLPRRCIQRTLCRVFRAMTASITVLPGPVGISVTRFQRKLEFCSRPRSQGRQGPMMARWVVVPSSRQALDPLKHVVEAD
jgi:hypothetical protein